MSRRIDRLSDRQAAVVYGCTAAVAVLAANVALLLSGEHPSLRMAAIWLAVYVPVFTALSTWRHRRRRRARPPAA